MLWCFIFLFVFVLFLVCPMLPVSLDCPFVIGKSNNLKVIDWKKVTVPEQDCQNRLRSPTMKKKIPHCQNFSKIQSKTVENDENRYPLHTYLNNDRLIDFFVLNATFSNISAISWRPVLVVEEAGVPGENHRPWVSNW